MIKNNLAVLLAERGYSATDVFNATKISKTTLTSLVNNTGKGVQFDTINTLCKFLKIEPNDFFIYTKYDYKLKDFYQMDEINSSTDPKSGELLYLQTFYKLVIFFDDGILPATFEYVVIGEEDMRDQAAGEILEIDEDEKNVGLRGYKVLHNFFEESEKIFVNEFMADLKIFIEEKGTLSTNVDREVTIKIFDKIVKVNAPSKRQ